MRKTRLEDTPKVRPNKSRPGTMSKMHGGAAAKEEPDRGKRVTDRRSPSDKAKAKSSLGVTSMQTGPEEPKCRELGALSRTKVSATSGNAGPIRKTSKSTPAIKNSLNTTKSRMEQKVRSEKRGTSIIYMPEKSDVTSKTIKAFTPVEVTKHRSGVGRKDVLKVQKVKDASSEPKNEYTARRRLPSRERKRSRTLSPSEVKVLHSQLRTAGSKTVATKDANIAKSGHSYDNKNMRNGETDVGPNKEYVYEDDFEDYESDFEECTDSEVSEISERTNKSDEIIAQQEPIELRTEKQKTTINSSDSTKKPDEDRMLDSGHYELDEARRRAARIDTISMSRDSKISDTEILVQSSINPYRVERSNENKSLPSSMDEGFEESRSGDFAKSPPLSRIAFIDFRKSPSKDNNDTVPKSLSISKVVSRGEKLLEMIKLDIVEWSIHEIKPVAYEEFMRTHGKLNTRQICVQTSEDNLDVETQTDRIECTSKWTQFPARCRTTLETDNDMRLFNVECLGVGTESDLDSSTSCHHSLPRAMYDVLQLNEFLDQAGKVMLCLLEEKASGGGAHNSNSNNENLRDFPFSEGAIKLSVDTVTFLAGRQVAIVHYANSSNRVLLTIHAPTDEDIETSRDEDFVTDCSIGCVWNVGQPSRPMKIFYSPSMITACCFHSTNCNIVLAGLEDGSISIWDLAEEVTWHRRIVDEANNCEWIIRSPTYSSLGNFEASGHDSEVVALRVLSKAEGEHEDAYSRKFVPIQISSLDANGRLIVWSVLRNISKAGFDDLGLSWWSDLRLVKSQEISLNTKKTLEKNNYLKGFSDMHVDRLDTNALFIATNTTNILHATRIGKHANPPAYKSNEMDWCGETTCIENCPFEQPFFLVGCGDGTVRLHRTTAEKPLLQLKHADCNAAIKAIQWSRSKPLTIYVLDVHSKIHIWDLGSSDIFPVLSVSTRSWAHIDSIELSPCRTNYEMANQYMALGSENGYVEVHRLRKEFCYSQKDVTKREINTFLRYVEIL